MSFSNETDEIDRAEHATRALAACGLGPVEWVAETGSTNEDLLEAATAGAAHGAIRVADHQLSGRGRRDRRWTAASGEALLVSVLLRTAVPPSHLAVLTAAMGVGAVEGCQVLGFDGIELKWPNDLVVGPAGSQRKLAGILAESVITADDLVVVVGLGLNITSTGLGALGSQAIALDELGPPPDPLRLLIAVFQAFSERLAQVERDPTDMWRAYRGLSATLGRRVRVVTDGDVVLGIADGMTEAGALLVRTDEGIVEVLVGDVTALRPVD